MRPCGVHYDLLDVHEQLYPSGLIRGVASREGMSYTIIHGLTRGEALVRITKYSKTLCKRRAMF